MSGFLCLFAEGHCACSDGFPPRPPLPEGRVWEHARPQHFADQPRVTGSVDPELLLSPLRDYILRVSHIAELHGHVVSLAPMQLQTARPVCLR